MLRHSISRSIQSLIQVTPALAQFLELHQVKPGLSCPTLIQLRVEVATCDTGRLERNDHMVLPIQELNGILKAALNAAKVSVFSSVDEILLTFQAQLSANFKSYCQLSRSFDLELLSFELEFENGLRLKVQNEELELQERFKLNVVHELAIDESPLHGHDMEVGVTLALQKWVTHPELTSLQRFSSELKERTTALLLRPLNKTKLNRFFVSPTGEKLADHFFKVLSGTRLAQYLKAVRVIETLKNHYSTTKI